MSTHFLAKEQPKAEKPYYCDLCRESIVVGERHVKTPWIMDGHRGRNRLHIQCDELCARYCSESCCVDDEYEFDYVVDWARDNGLWPPVTSIVRLQAELDWLCAGHDTV